MGPPAAVDEPARGAVPGRIQVRLTYFVPKEADSEAAESEAQ